MVMLDLLWLGREDDARDVAEGGIMPSTARSLSTHAGTAMASQRAGDSHRSPPSCSGAGNPSTRAARRSAATASTSLRNASGRAPVCLDSFWPSSAKTSGVCR